MPHPWPERGVGVPTTSDSPRTIRWIVQRASGSWPLIVYLPGGSQRGDNRGNAVGSRADTLPVVQAITERPELFPALV